METTIQTGQSYITMSNVFTVSPENQQRLLDLLVRATDEVMYQVPGFISANLHRSLDGVRVINYTQWESEAAFKAMFGFPGVKEHMDGAYEIATADYHIHEVAHVRHA